VGNANYTDATFQEALKISWPEKRLQKMMLERNPTAAMVPIKDFPGRSLYLPVQVGIQAGRSAVFATAQTNRVGSQQKAFVLTTVKDYAVGGIDGETLEAIESEDSLIEGIKDEMEGSFEILQRSIAVHVHGDGSGSIGRIGTDDSATKFTLSNKYDSVNFFVGQVIQANPNKTGNSGTMRAGTGTVTAIDHDSGAVTYSAAGGFNPAASDHLYIEGDYDAKMKGFEAWNPETAPTVGDNFFSIDRSTNVAELSGHRFDGSSMNPIDAINKGLAHASALGCMPTVMVVNPMEMFSIKQDLGNKAVIDLAVKSVNDPTVQFEGIVFVQGNRKVKLVEDVNCPRGVIRGFKPEDIAIYARKKGFPRILNRDGNTMRAESSADAYQWRLGFYAQMGCKRPKNLLRIKIAFT